jgi:hypothetical protein
MCFKMWVIKRAAHAFDEVSKQKKKLRSVYPRSSSMAGTRLLITGSFALPFGLLTVLSFYHGIPGDDMLWKRLKALLSLWFGLSAADNVPQYFPQHNTAIDDESMRMMMRVAGLSGVQEIKPLLVVPTSSSWVVNEWDQLLYEVVRLSEAEVESMCQQPNGASSASPPHHQQAGSSLERRATIVLCRGSTKVIARQNYVYLYSKSKQEFRNMLHSAMDPAGPSVQPVRGRPQVVVQVLLDQIHGHNGRSDSSSSWKEMVDHLVVGLSSLGHDNPCLDDDDVSLEFTVLRNDDDDEPNLMGRLLATGGGNNIEDIMAEFFATTRTTSSYDGSNNDGHHNNKVILYMTSSEQVQVIHQQLGAVEFRLTADASGGGVNYLYIRAMDYNADHDDDKHHRSALFAAVQDGLQRIILHECWNLPLDIVVANDENDDGSDEEGLRTLYQVYNATMTRLMVHRLQEKARWLQYRIDHLHSTASVTSRRHRSSSNNDIGDHGGIQSAVRELLFRGRLEEARQLVESVRFGMVPDFPYDQYAAIFAPLLFPLLLPVVLTTIREVKRYRQHHKTA